MVGWKHWNCCCPCPESTSTSSSYVVVDGFVHIPVAFIQLVYAIQGSDLSSPMSLCTENRQLDVVKMLMKHKFVNMNIEKVSGVKSVRDYLCFSLNS